MKKLLLALALSASTVAVAQPAAAQSLGVDFASAGNFGSSSWNLGWSFTANTNLTVVALGSYFAGNYSQDQLVGLWDSTGALLASTYVSNSDATLGQSGLWKFADISAVNLSAGQTYVVGSQGGAIYTGEVSNPTFDSDITYGTDLYISTGSNNTTLVEPTLTETFPHGWFGGNVEFGAASVPEPASWMMMISGFGLLGGALRRKKIAVSFG